MGHLENERMGEAQPGAQHREEKHWRVGEMVE